MRCSDVFLREEHFRLARLSMMIKVLPIHSLEDPSTQIRTTHKTGGPDSFI